MEQAANPVDNELADVWHVVETDMLSPPFRGEGSRFPVRAIDGLLAKAAGLFHGILAVALPMGDEKGEGGLLYDSVELHVSGNINESVQVVVAPHPHDVLPVVTHGAPSPLSIWRRWTASQL